ncbi:MAG: phosphodiester glycosidase family protein [Kofleriaceae bacterium]
MLRGVVIVCVLARVAAASPMMTFSGDPHPGIHRETWEDTAVPWRARIVQIDLTSAEIAVYATKESDRGLTVSAYADREAAQVAINGDAFSVANFTPRGLAMGASDVWSNTADDDTSAVLHFRRVGETTAAGIIAAAPITTPADLPVGTEGVISGRPLVVSAGAVPASFDCTDDSVLACQRTPRTAVGLSADGNTMYLVVVDGWQAGTIGMTATELGQFMLAHGAYQAINLDGGSSSALNVDGNLISAPSDGVERAVANHLAVKYGSLPKGQLVGLICKHDVIGCSDDASRKLLGVKVYLDDGREFTTASGAELYDFTNVTQRYACVTAKKTGYITKTQCAQVTGTGLTYNSIAMWEGVDTPDAGVPMDAPTDENPDGGSGPHETSDGGNAQMGGGGGCCQSSGGTDLSGIVIVALCFMRRRLPQA